MQFFFRISFIIFLSLLSWGIFRATQGSDLDPIWPVFFLTLFFPWAIVGLFKLLCIAVYHLRKTWIQAALDAQKK